MATPSQETQNFGEISVALRKASSASVSFPAAISASASES